MLADAHNAADADTVAEFFRAYWKEKGVAAPATPAPAPAPAPTIDPATLVAPSAGAPSQPSTQPQRGRMWTQAEIEGVYDDAIHKRITPARLAELEVEIQQAILAGRVKA